MEKNIEKLKIDEEKKIKENKNRKIYLIIFFILICIVIMVYLSKSLEKKEVEITRSFIASNDENIVELNASGYITPRRKATVAAKITGRVKEILVDEGSRVKEGQLLAILDKSDAIPLYERAIAYKESISAQISGAKAKLEESEKNLKRGEKLLKDGIIDEASYDALKSDYELVKSQYESLKKSLEEAEKGVLVAERELSNCEVKAPFEGIVVSKDAQPGEIVSPVSAGGGFTRTGIVTIVDMNSLEIEVDVNESNLSKIYEGQKAIAILDAYPDFKIEAKVRTIIPSADRQKATVKVRISILKKDPRILPDMGVRVSFLREGEKIEGVCVSRDAILKNSDGLFLFKIVNGKVKKIKIEAEKEFPDFVSVKEGIREGEVFVLNPTEKLKDGTRVKVKNG